MSAEMIIGCAMVAIAVGLPAFLYLRHFWGGGE